MAKILVTGGAGFVGSNLCLSLVDKGHTVFSLDNYFTGLKTNHHVGVKYFTGHTRDIADIFREESFDMIYHLGEYSRVEKSFEDPIGLVWDLNIAGTFAVLEFWKKQNNNKSCKLIYSGSSTKFADSEGGETGSQMSPYAWSKAGNTEIVKNYSRWYNLPYAITYFYNVYGDNEISSGPYSTLIGIFKKQFLNSVPLTVVKPGDQKRNFTYVGDIVNALVLIGEKGEGDEFGIGSDEAFSVLEVAEMFKSKIIFFPERKGNRKSAEVMSQKTKALGWSAKVSLESYISSFIAKNVKENREIKDRVLVFTTTFYPREGFAEKTLLEAVKSMPDTIFDIVTTKIGQEYELEKVLPTNIVLHRIGSGKNYDKIQLLREGFGKALELSQKNNYAFVWSILASYGAVPALLFKKRFQIPLLISLGDQKIPSIINPKHWALRFIIRGGDQVSTNALLEDGGSRKTNLKWLSSLNNSGDVFPNAFRFTYNTIFKELFKR